MFYKLTAAFLLMFGMMIFGQAGSDFGMYQDNISIAGHNINVDIADSEQERAYGLMYRKSMPDSCGMLFVFEAAAVQSFWMRNTYIPLSIAYIDENGIIVRIKDMEPLDLTGVTSDYPAQYALEVNKGWFNKRGIKEGDSVDF